jgi:hypothetical protein
MSAIIYNFASVKQREENQHCMELFLNGIK